MSTVSNVSLFSHSDFNGNPRPYTNTRGMMRIPGARDLASLLRSSDPLFLDFVKRCLEYVSVQYEA